MRLRIMLKNGQELILETKADLKQSYLSICDAINEMVNSRRCVYFPGDLWGRDTFIVTDNIVYIESFKLDKVK